MHCVFNNRIKHWTAVMRLCFGETKRESTLKHKLTAQHKLKTWKAHISLIIWSGGLPHIFNDHKFFFFFHFQNLPIMCTLFCLSKSHKQLSFVWLLFPGEPLIYTNCLLWVNVSYCWLGWSTWGYGCNDTVIVAVVVSFQRMQFILALRHFLKNSICVQMCLVRLWKVKIE